MVVPMAKAHIGREIGEKLRQLAHARGFSQGQVAENAHISQPTVSALFNGQTLDPPIGTVLKVAKVLKVSLDDLVDAKPLPIPEPATEDDRLSRVEDAVASLARALAPVLEGSADHLVQQLLAGEKATQSGGTRQRQKQVPKRAV